MTHTINTPSLMNLKQLNERLAHINHQNEVGRLDSLDAANLLEVANEQAEVIRLLVAGIMKAKEVYTELECRVLDDTLTAIGVTTEGGI